MRRRTLFLLSPLCLPLALGLAGPARADGDGGETDAAAPPPGFPVPLRQMESALAERFPRRYPVPGLIDLDLQTPHLQPLPRLNRLQADLTLSASGPALRRAHQGQLDIDFALRYEPADQTVRAHQLRLHRLRFPSLPPPVVELLNTFGPELARENLQELVLHRLGPQDLRLLNAMGMQPGAITVTDAGLVIGLELKPL